jgi:hypothetical protein
VELEVALAGDVERGLRRIAGDDAAVTAGDADPKHQRGRQQAIAAQVRQGGAGAFQLDRVLEHLQGLVDAAQAVRQLRLIGVGQFLHRVGGGGLAGVALDVHEVGGGHPDRHQQQQRGQRQQDMGLQAAPEPAVQRRVPVAGAGIVDARRCACRFYLCCHVARLPIPAPATDACHRVSVQAQPVDMRSAAAVSTRGLRTGQVASACRGRRRCTTVQRPGRRAVASAGRAADAMPGNIAVKRGKGPAGQRRCCIQCPRQVPPGGRLRMEESCSSCLRNYRGRANDGGQLSTLPATAGSADKFHLRACIRGIVL